MNTEELRERDEHIAQARRDGTASLGQLAKQYGLSRERIRQIAAKYGVDSTKAAGRYREQREHTEFDRANEVAPILLMRFIAGDTVRKIARDMDLKAPYVQEVLDEQVTDDILAARSNRITAERFPTVGAGPREEAPVRQDRYWTPERCVEALVRLARENGGILPPSSRYQKLSPLREDLPSFATVRNRLGRWTAVRAEVHRHV